MENHVDAFSFIEDLLVGQVRGRMGELDFRTSNLKMIGYCRNSNPAENILSTM